MSISAKELAAILGVSPATISMVMNEKPGISDATRKLVLQAADEYGYIYKKSKKKEASASVIQFVTYKKHEEALMEMAFLNELAEGITHECSLHNYALHISYIHESENVKEQTDALREIKCIGILLLATEMAPEDFKFFLNFPVPIIVLDCYYDSLAFDYVLTNNVQGSFQATDHLIQCGHRKIGYLHSSVPCANYGERENGFYQALLTNGISPDTAPVHLLSPMSQEGYQDMMRILSEKPELAEAYFADNDVIAAAAMKAFQEYGYRIPEDISLIGFDDMPLCDMMTPALSTMDVPKWELGAAAVRQLIFRSNEPNSGYQKLSLFTTLVNRESVLDKTQKN